VKQAAENRRLVLADRNCRLQPYEADSGIPSIPFIINQVICPNEVIEETAMRLWRLGVWGCLGLALGGCEEPEQIVPVTPPGAVIPRTPPDNEEPAHAQGEVLPINPKALAESTKPAAHFLATSTAKGEIKTTKNGVKYETLKEGTGAEIKPGQVARLHYEGRLENGTLFESTRQQGNPATFVIGSGRLIKGWEEAIPGMRAGEIRRLVIPPSMGYGAKEHAKIPANSTLIFEVELLGIN
jgi:FKBP-type peptidyl-prolyl cis-trans isomerase